MGDGCECVNLFDTYDFFHSVEPVKVVMVMQVII